MVDKIEIIKRGQIYYARIRQQSDGVRSETTKSLKTKNRTKAGNLVKRFIDFCESNNVDVAENLNQIHSYAHGPELMLRSAIDQFLTEKSRVLADESHKLYRHILYRFMETCGNVPLSRINTDMIRSYVTRRDGISPATMRKDARHIKAFWNYCMEQGFTNRPFPKIEFPRQQIKQKAKMCSRKELDMIFVAFDRYHKEESARKGSRYRDSRKQEWFKPLMIFFFETGLRRKEALQLKKSDIKEGKHIHVYESKSGAERLVPISDWLAGILIPYIKMMKPNELVFPFSSDHVTREFRKYADLAGFPDKTIHGFRHGRVTGWIEQGFSTMEVKEMAGHSTIVTTQGYSHLAAERLYDKLKRLNSDGNEK